MITIWLDPNNWKKEKLPEERRPAVKDRIYQSLLVYYVRNHIPFDEVEYRDIPEFINSSINGWNDSSHNICIIRTSNSQSQCISLGMLNAKILSISDVLSLYSSQGSFLTTSHLFYTLYFTLLFARDLARGPHGSY